MAIRAIWLRVPKAPATNITATRCVCRRTEEYVPLQVLIYVRSINSRPLYTYEQTERDLSGTTYPQLYKPIPKRQDTYIGTYLGL